MTAHDDRDRHMHMSRRLGAEHMFSFLQPLGSKYRYKIRSEDYDLENTLQPDLGPRPRFVGESVARRTGGA